MFRRTKIVATLGPASSSDETLRAMMNAGVDVFRVNFSHGDRETKADLIRRIRDLSRQSRRAVGILGDLQGPKIRTGLMTGGELLLIQGTEVRVTTRDVVGAGDLIPTSYRELPQDVRPGDRILLDDGLMELEVLATAGDEVRCLVRSGGVLRDRKGMNLPGVQVSVPALTPKDREDLLF